MVVLLRFEGLCVFVIGTPSIIWAVAVICTFRFSLVRLERERQETFLKIDVGRRVEER